MRIVIIHSGVRGIASYCLNLYDYLIKNGHEVLFISEAKWEKRAIPLYQAKSVKFLGLVPVVYDPRGVVDAINKFKPDLIHHHWPSGTMDVLFWKVMKLNYPTAVTLHVSINSTQFFFDKMFYYHFGQFIKYFKDIKYCVSISKFIEDQAKARIKMPESKFVIIHTGVNQEIFKQYERPADDGTLNLLFVGQIMAEKGIDILIDAVKSISSKKKINLKIIGYGHLKPFLQKKTANDKNIEWVGFLKGQEVIAKYYSNADLTILPTRWDEAFSLVPVESLACGTPVLASNKGGTPEIVIPKKTGFLLDKVTKEEIAKIIMDVDKKSLEALRPACRKLVLSKHTLDMMGKSHIELYKNMIKQ